MGDVALLIHFAHKLGGRGCDVGPCGATSRELREKNYCIKDGTLIKRDDEIVVEIPGSILPAQKKQQVAIGLYRDE